MLLKSLKFAPVRTMYLKRKPVPLVWKKPAIEEHVLDMLFDYCPSHEQDVHSLTQVALVASMKNTLLIDSLDRFGFYMDLLEHFDIVMPIQRSLTRDFASGREAADWVATQLEQEGRLWF